MKAGIPANAGKLTSLTKFFRLCCRALATSSLCELSPLFCSASMVDTGLGISRPTVILKIKKKITFLCQFQVLLLLQHKIFTTVL